MGEVNGCGACKIYIKMERGPKNFISRVKRTVIERVSLFLVLMAPVIPEKVPC